MTKLGSGGVPLGIGGCGSAAAHAADGIVPGRPVCRAEEPFLAAETSTSRSKNETSTRGSAFVATGSVPGAIPSSLPPRPVFARAPLAPASFEVGTVLLNEVDRAGFDAGRRGSRSFLAGASRLLPVGNSLGARLLQVAARALADPFDLFLDALQLACEASS